MKLIVFDYMLLGIAAMIIGNHVVFMIYDTLKSRRRGNKSPNIPGPSPGEEEKKQ